MRGREKFIRCGKLRIVGLIRVWACVRLFRKYHVEWRIFFHTSCFIKWLFIVSFDIIKISIIVDTTKFIFTFIYYKFTNKIRIYKKFILSLDMKKLLIVLAFLFVFQSCKKNEIAIPELKNKKFPKEKIVEPPISFRIN